ncbi:hypothetical protein ACFMQL_33385 [Nonomuraea fastidiosa]|jgi:hypothetical protein|uniref:hypothetical protein n=1 Tax=Nonomuraea TaxID=83681 RepID=UPI003440DC95
MSYSPHKPLLASILALVLAGGGGATACALPPQPGRGGDDGARTGATAPEENEPEKERAAVRLASYKGEDLCSIFPAALLKKLVPNAEENPADDTSTLSSAESTCEWNSGEQPSGRIDHKRHLEVSLLTYDKAQGGFNAQRHFGIKKQDTQEMLADPPPGTRFGRLTSVPGLGESSYAFTTVDTGTPTKSVDAEVTFELSGALVILRYSGYDSLPGLNGGYRRLPESQVMSSAQQAAKAFAAALLKGGTRRDDDSGEAGRITAASRGQDVCKALPAETVRKYVGKARTSARNNEYSDERWAVCSWSSTFEPDGSGETAYDMVDLRVQVTTMKKGAAAARVEFREKKKAAAATPAGVSERLTKDSGPVAVAGIGEEAFVQIKTSTQIVNRREAVLVYRVGGQVVQVTFGGLSTVATTAGPDSGTTALSQERVLNPVKDVAKQLAARTTGR